MANFCCLVSFYGPIWSVDVFSSYLLLLLENVQFYVACACFLVQTLIPTLVFELRITANMASSKLCFRVEVIGRP